MSLNFIGINKKEEEKIEWETHPKIVGPLGVVLEDVIGLRSYTWGSLLFLPLLHLPLPFFHGATFRLQPASGPIPPTDLYKRVLPNIYWLRPSL